MMDQEWKCPDCGRDVMFEYHAATCHQFGRDMPKDQEVRIVDPVTGGEKGQKITRYDLIPPEFEDALARHYGEGAKKYADRNWEKGYRWGLSYRSVRTHLNQWQQGETFDQETGTHHLICAIWHLIALYVFETRSIGTNDLK